MNLKVAVICGGYSSEKEISMKSVDMVIANLEPSKYDPVKVIIDKNGWLCEIDGVQHEIDRKDFSYNNSSGKFDFAFIMIHGTPGEDGKLQAYFDMIRMPYSTCNHLMSTLTFNKWANNLLLSTLGFTCAESVMLRRNEKYDSEEIVNKLGLPIFVKPCDGGSSFGVTKVKQKNQLDNAIKKAMSEGTDALLESFISGTEVTCGAYHNGKDFVVLPITEIVSKNEFFDYNAKYIGEADEITPARISEVLTTNIQDQARRICVALDLRGIVRIDFIIQDNVPVLIEVNTVPGFSPASIVPQQIKAAGKKVSEVLDEVIQAQLLYFA